MLLDIQASLHKDSGTKTVVQTLKAPFIATRTGEEAAESSDDSSDALEIFVSMLMPGQVTWLAALSKEIPALACNCVAAL